MNPPYDDAEFSDPSTVSIPQLMNRLKLSRNFITRHITHAVKHVEENRSKGSVVLFDKADLCNWLQTHATFTRQTHFVNIDKLFREEQKKNPNADIDEFLALPPEVKSLGGIDATKRRLVPAVPVESFNFWDKLLIFPKEYHADLSNPESPLLSPELCYRDMFRIGAVKIQLGRQKTIFCIPELQRDEYHTLIYETGDTLMPIAWQPYTGWEIPESGLANNRQKMTPAKYARLTTPKPLVYDMNDPHTITASRSLVGDWGESSAVDDAYYDEVVDRTPEKPYRDRHYDITVRSDSDTFSSQAVQHALKSGFDIQRVISAYRDQATNETVMSFNARIRSDIPDQDNIWIPGKTVESEIPAMLEKLQRMLKCMADSDKATKENIRKQLDYLSRFADDLFRV